MSKTERFNFKEFVKKNPPTNNEQHVGHEEHKGHKKSKSSTDKFKKFSRYGLKLGK